jgi:hypothetical protein
MKTSIPLRQAEVIADSTCLSTPEERDVFDICGGWIEPEDRL